MTAKEQKYGEIIGHKIYFIKRLDELGIQRKYLGYYSLIEIMDVLINRNKCVVSFSRDVYPEIASKYGKSPCTIERNIRSLIKNCWSLNMMEKLNVYYVDDQKPTCREFIYLVKNYVCKYII